MVLKMKKEAKIILLILLLAVVARLLVAQIEQRQEYQSGAEGEDREPNVNCQLTVNIAEPEPTITLTPVPSNIPPTSTPTLTLTPRPTGVNPLAKTCWLSISQTTIGAGEEVTIYYGGDSNCDNQEKARLWLSQRDGLAFDGIEGYVRREYVGEDDNVYYELSNAGKSVISLLSGDYQLHCDMFKTDEGCSPKCSGNLFCDFEGGSYPCLAHGWVDCSTNDNVFLTVE